MSRTLVSVTLSESTPHLPEVRTNPFVVSTRLLRSVSETVNFGATLFLDSSLRGQNNANPITVTRTTTNPIIMCLLYRRHSTSTMDSSAAASSASTSNSTFLSLVPVFLNLSRKLIYFLPPFTSSVPPFKAPELGPTYRKTLYSRPSLSTMSSLKNHLYG